MRFFSHYAFNHQGQTYQTKTYKVVKVSNAMEACASVCLLDLQCHFFAVSQNDCHLCNFLTYNTDIATSTEDLKQFWLKGKATP